MTNRDISGSRKTILLYECAKCVISDFVVVRTGVPLQIENSNNTMRHRGWVIHKSKRAKVYCPDCKVTATTNDVNSELRNIDIDLPAIVSAPAQQQEMELASASVVTALTVAPPRPITTDERVGVRNALDMHFDDKKGVYLDDMSDAAIAAKLGIPRIHVETIRESAYGPIKIDAETAAIFKEIEDLKRATVEFGRAWDNFGKGLEDLNRRIAALTERAERRGK